MNHIKYFRRSRGHGEVEHPKYYFGRVRSSVSSDPSCDVSLLQSSAGNSLAGQIVGWVIMGPAVTRIP